MKVDTYSDGNPLIPEGNKGSPVPHFAWFYSDERQINSEPALAAKSTDSGSKISKVREQKPSTKGSNQIAASKVLKPKKPKKGPSVSKKTKGQSIPAAKREKNNLNVEIDATNLDFSGVPSPVCSCTGAIRVCYKWGAGGWQSSCCTISISEYPLPMSSSRPGSRLAGRKMSKGAYGKLLLRLEAEGHDLAHSVDLKNHWARHGTNKFVTIK